jgi:hypothetical protein
MSKTYKLATVTRTCIICESDFRPRADWVETQQCCSLACANRANIQIALERRAHRIRPTQACPHCHQTFTASRSGKRYCSPDCQRGDALSHARYSAQQSPQANEQRRAVQRKLIAEGRHPFLGKRFTSPRSPKQHDTAVANKTHTTRTLPTHEMPPLPPLPTEPEPITEEAEETSVVLSTSHSSARNHAGRGWT